MELLLTCTCFNPYFNGYSTLTFLIKLNKDYTVNCFNPYFNGYSTLTVNSWTREKKDLGFNPYFNGYSTLTPEFFIFGSGRNFYYKLILPHFFDFSKFFLKNGVPKLILQIISSYYIFVLTIF